VFAVRALRVAVAFLAFGCASTPPTPSLPEGVSRDGVRCLPEARTPEGGVVECYEGYDAIAYRDLRRTDGSRVQSYFVEGVFEYMRILTSATGGRTVLLRQMCDAWSSAGRPVQGADSPGGGTGYRCERR
jgi:hypothetical protein